MSPANSNSTLTDLKLSLPAPLSDYYTDFTSHVNSVRINLSFSDPASSNLNTADHHLQQAADLLKSLELESRTTSADLKRALGPLLSNARSELQTLRTDLRTARVNLAESATLANQRDELFEGAEDAGHRKDILDVTGRLEEGGEMIQGSRRLIAETEMVGAGILEDLQNQRNTILRARDSVTGVASGLDQSSSVLGTMQRRAIVNRIIVWVVLGGIAFACIGVLYARLFHARGRG